MIRGAFDEAEVIARGTPLGLRGSDDLDPRWRHVGPMFEQLERDYVEGGVLAMEPAARRILAATGAGAGALGEADAQRLELRARAVVNLAAVAEAGGELESAEALAAQAVELCLASEAAPDARRSAVEVRAAAHIGRAQTLALLGRDEEGLLELAAAEQALGNGGAPPLLRFALSSTRANALLATERYAAAEAELEVARDIALQHESRLVAYAYAGLAATAHRTGDRRLARERMRIARELQTDPVAAARADENLARMLLEQPRADTDLAEAETLLEEAEQGYLRGGDPRGVAGCRYGRATALFARGLLPAAHDLAREALAGLTAQGDVSACIETRLLLGDIHVASRDYAEAERCYLSARDLSERQGTAHETARIDVRRAVAVHDRADGRGDLEEALQLALPAALAADAMRHGFAPGAARERWITGVASVALSIVLQIATSLRSTRLVIELLEFSCSSASLDATEGAVPPRVRALPGEQSGLEAWIAEAERRYRLRIRSEATIDAW